jgi:hypothetical protein
MPLKIFALLQFDLTTGILIAAILMAALWGPYLYKEIRRGKVELGPRTPTGTGDNHPGTRFNPAPGLPDAQADPYSPSAQREAPPIKS